MKKKNKQKHRTKKVFSTTTDTISTPSSTTTDTPTSTVSNNEKNCKVSSTTPNNISTPSSTTTDTPTSTVSNNEKNCKVSSTTPNNISTPSSTTTDKEKDDHKKTSSTTTDTSPFKTKAKTDQKHTNIVWNILYSLIPLLGFWWVDSHYGLEAGLIVAIILAILEVLWYLIKEKRLEPFATWSAILILIMGGISWQFQNDVFIKLKPAILESVFAGIFFFSCFINKPFLLVVAKKQLGNNLSDFQMQHLRSLNWHIGIFFLIHIMIAVYAALYTSNDTWMFLTGPFFYIFFILFFIMEFILSRYKWHRYNKRLQSQHIFLQYQRNIINNMKYSTHITQEEIISEEMQEQ